MCKHNWIRFPNGVSACNLCGLTLLRDGKVVFDQQFTNVGKTKKRRRKNAKTRK